jgi:general secretion pathway protein I
VTSASNRRPSIGAWPSARIAALRGFTLVEVLVALVVVSLGMLAVIQAVGQTASNSTYMRDKTIAHWIAMNRVTQARLEQQPPKIDETSDEVEMAGRKWRWTMEVTQTPVDTVRRIDIKVRAADAPEDSSLASVTGFYGTAIAQPGTTLIDWQGLRAGPGGPGGPGPAGPGPGGRTEPPRDGDEPAQPNPGERPRNPSPERSPPQQ